MANFRILFSAFFLGVFLNGCGGGGAGGSTTSPDGSLSYSPSSLSFSAQVDAERPADKIITLTAQEAQTEVPELSIATDVLDSVALNIVSDDTIEVTVRVKTPALLSIGTHTASVNISSSQYTLSIPVTYTVTDIPPGDPEVNYISPYIISPGTASDVIIRGSGFSRFDSTNLPAVTIGSLASSNISIVNDSEIRVTSPALTAGSHTVQISGDGINFTSTVSLQVIADQTYSTTSYVTTGEKSKLIFDKERQALYVVNTTSGTLERYQYQSGTTWDMDSLSLSGLSDAALSPDGNTLVMVDGSSFYEVDPAASIMTTGPAVNAPLFSLDSVSKISWTNSGNMMAVGNNQWSSVYSYDLLTGQSDRLQYLNSSEILVGYSIYNPWLFDAPDGSKIFLGEVGKSTSYLYQLDASDNTITTTGLSTAYSGYSSVALTPDSSTILVNGMDIYNADLTTLLGSLPQAHTRGVLSPDGTIAYVFTDFISDSENNILKAFDISDPASPVQIGSDVTLTNGPGMRARMRISDDGNTLFIAGTENLLIIDLTTFSF